MQTAIKILLRRAKEYKAELEARGTSVEAETERLRKAGLLLVKESNQQDNG